MEKEIILKDAVGGDIKVKPELFLYVVKDFMGNAMNIIGISLNQITEEGEVPYADITKSFNEFIGLKNCAYIDTNNCPFADKLLEMNYAKDTGLTKHSGFWDYPLWRFEEKFLKEIGGELYDRYSREFDEYMHCNLGLDMGQSM